MKIIFLDSDTLGHDISLSPIESKGELICYPYTEENDVIERIVDADVVIVNKVIIGKREIDAAPKLKLICVAATGVNNVDVEYAKRRGIPVKNAVGYSTESVVQVTFSGLLSLMNSVSYFDRVVKSKEYCASKHFTDTGRAFFELSGKNFGIIGMGTIGKRVAQVAKAFGANVFYYPTGGVAHCRDYPALSLEELLSKSDIISVHAPLNERTLNLISMEQFRLMKTCAYVVNMGRGGIINESDLVKALNYNLISGAVVDVFSKEPLPVNHPYYSIKDMDKVILTPHIGWASAEARVKLVKMIADNIE